MPRFFFHLVGGRQREQDEIGLNFPSLEAAYLDAFEAAYGIWTEMVSMRQDPTPYLFEIADGNGLILMELPFLEIVESTQRGGAGMMRPPVVRHRRARTSRLSGEVAAEIETARAVILRSREILKRSRAMQTA